jgi:hypothetical protein
MLPVTSDKVRVTSDEILKVPGHTTTVSSGPHFPVGTVGTLFVNEGSTGSGTVD